MPSPHRTPTWDSQSWRALPARQQAEYGDAQALSEVERFLSTLPPLTTPSECRALKAELAQAAQGNAFLLQGGDCAESFAEFSEKNLRSFFRVLLQMTMALMYGA